MRTENGVSTRKSVTLPEGVNKRLTAYALAAGAAGVGVLALAQPAEADIIVKSENIVINSSHPNETLTIVGSHRLSFGFVSRSGVIGQDIFIGVSGHRASVKLGFLLFAAWFLSRPTTRWGEDWGKKRCVRIRRCDGRSNR